MKREIRGVAALMALGMVVASPARAQGTTAGTAMTPATTKAVVFGAKVGVAFPVGDLGNAAGTGFDLGGVVGFTVPNFPLGLRGDLDYDHFGSKTVSVGQVSASAKSSIWSGTVNALYGFPMEGSSFRPYAIGGVGLYHLSSSADCSGAACGAGFSTSNSETKFGLNIGGGVEFQLYGFSTFAEARFHNVFTNGSSARYIPITIGVMFR